MNYALEILKLSHTEIILKKYFNLTGRTIQNENYFSKLFEKFLYMKRNLSLENFHTTVIISLNFKLVTVLR